MWPFECIGPNGQTYLHNDNWKQFIKEREIEYPHDWGHRRALITLCSPRKSFCELPHVTVFTTLNYIEDGFSLIFEPYPAHMRTGSDPDGNEESWNVFIEDGVGEKITLLSTSISFWPNPYRPFETDVFAFFRDKYWRVLNLQGGGLGVTPPPALPKPPEKKKMEYRSLDDDWI